MKKLLILLLIGVSTLSSAQTAQKGSTITTYHSEYYPIAVEAYRSKIDLSITNNNYGAPCYASVTEMEEAFYKKVKDLGLSTSNISKDEMEFLKTGYNREGMTYVFTTKNEQDIKKFMKVKMPNGYPRVIEYKLSEPSINLTEYAKKALANTRLQADAIAKSLDKKVVEPKEINASQSRYNKKWTSYKEEGYLSLNVIYTIE